MRETIHSLLDQSLSPVLSRAAEIAVAHQRGLRVARWTYGRLAQTACQFARELESRGIGKGDRVLFWGENRPEWIAAFFGCLMRGAVAVPMDEQSPLDFVHRVQRQVEARLLICGDEQARHFKDQPPALRLDQLVEAVGRHSTTPYQDEKIGADDLAEIIFTSGTTAEPKGVRLTHRNLLANITPLETEIKKYLKFERPFHPIRFLCLLPLSHVFGQFMGIFVPRLLFGEVFFQSHFNSSEIIATVKRERISVIAAVPRQLESLREKIERDYSSRGELEKFLGRFASAEGKHFLRRWWIFRDVHRQFGWKFWAFVSGGATLDEETETFWQRLGFAVVQGYGMTETASLVTVSHPFKIKHGSIGKTLPGQELKLDGSGEILVRGANVSAGYWQADAEEEKFGVPPSGGAFGARKRPAEAGTPNNSDDGWLRTGDVGEMDAAGNIFFKGRKKDVIVTAAGLNIYPDDLEAALNRQPEIKTSCVIGVEGPRGPEPLAALILRDENADPAEVVKRANTQLGQSQQIRRWFVWPEPDFPRTPTRKVRKLIVKESVLAKTSKTSKTSGATPASVHPGKGSSLVELIASISGDRSMAVGELDAKANLSADLKLDSLGRVQLLSALEDRYQIELDEASLTPETTLGDVERMIHEGRRVDGPADYPYPKWSRRRPITWLRRLAYYLLVAPFVCVMCWPRVRGREHLRDFRGPVLFIANHISMVDPGMILFALPFRFRHRLAIAMAGERLRGLRRGLEGGNWFGRLLDRLSYLLVVIVFNVFALPQKSGFRRGFAFAGDSVDQGYSVLVFPEGRTTEDGRMNPFMSGIGLLAGNLDLPVAPIKIEGLFDLTEQRRYFSSPGTVTITFGEPVSFERGTDPARITRELEDRMRALGARSELMDVLKEQPRGTRGSRG
ncbi:MAG TPA: AMP-binding protein [Blastocatellia bacterium]|nr:AMP-binding protein [Blastocatellia bacterium]